MAPSPRRRSIASRVEVPVGVDAHVDAAAGHPRARPRADVAEHDRAARGHVLEGEALGVGAVDDAAARVVERLLRLTAEHDVGAREADAEARVGRTLHEEAATLGAVGERLADGAVDAAPLGVRALQDRDGAAEHRLADAVLGAALDPDHHAPGVEGAEALAGDRAAVEARARRARRPGRPPAPRRRCARGRSPRRARCRARGRGRRSGAGTRSWTGLAARTPSRRARPAASRPPSAAIRIGRARTRPASARVRPRRAPPRRTGRSIGSRSRNSSSGVISSARSSSLCVERPARAGRSGPRGPGRARTRARPTTRLTSSPIEAKKRAQLSAAESTCCGVNFLRPCSVRLLDGLDLGRDADVAGVELAAAADRAAQRDHRQGAEGDPVGAHAVQLHDVVGVAVAAVGPDLDPVADPGLHQRAVDGPGADVGRQADVAQGVLAGGARAALEARQGDDVRARLRDPEADRADVRDHRHLHRDAEVRVHGLELVDQLGEVLDRVEVVVVGGRDQVGARAWRCAPRRPSRRPSGPAGGRPRPASRPARS